MVVKLADVEDESMEVVINKKKKKTKAKKVSILVGNKRPLEIDAGEATTLVPADSLEDSVESKKAKPSIDVDKDVLEGLEASEVIISSLISTHEAKLQCLTELFESIMEKNVNIVLLLSGDFPSWVKNAVLVILRDTVQVSVDFFRVITLAVKVVPAIFESVLDKVINVALFFPRQSIEVQESCDNFMEFIVHTFDKLRRFPKFIAKFLCCIRDNFKPEEYKNSYGNILCSKFTTAIGSVTSLLTVGQITDLWKTLQHNLEVECIKPLKEGTDDAKTKTFLVIVVDLFAEFLSNIKVADYTIPGTTIEKISELMDKLCQDCLQPFGCIVSSQKKLDLTLVKPYLNLSYAYGQLHGIMLCYNEKYKGNKPVLNPDSSTNAADLSYLHHYMDADSWISLSNGLLKRKDDSAIQSFVNLVVQKLTFMTALQQKSSSGNEQVEVQLKQAAEFIWTHQSKNSCLQFSEETLTLVSQYIEPHKMIELAATYIQQFQEDEGRFNDYNGGVSSSSINNVLCSTGNPTFHYALILEAIGEIMRRIQKMKLLPKQLKSILKDVLSLEAKTTLITESSFAKLNISQSSNKKCINNKSSHSIMESLLSFVNSILLESTSTTVSPTKKGNNNNKSGEEFSSQLINGMLQFLGSLDIETYPKDVKTVVFLCSFIILVALLEQNSDDLVLEPVCKLVVSSGGQSLGNEIVFSVHWVELFRWFTLRVDRFSPTAQLELTNMILGNIFMSPKFMTEFHTEIEKMCETVDLLDSSSGNISFSTLEFLLKELHNQSSKTKLTSQLQDHCGMLTKFVVSKLNESNNSTSSTSNFYRACWLAQSAVDKIMDEDTLNMYKKTLSSKIKKSLKFLKTSTLQPDNCCMYAIRFLHAVCKSRSKLADALPSEFLSKLWTSCLNPNVLHYDDQLSLQLQSHKSKIPKNFVKDMFEVASAADFQLICNSLMEKTTALGSSSNNFKEINMIVQILAEFVDAELTPENKPIRRHTLQECLHKILLLTLDWDVCDTACLNSAIIPYLKLQTKVLRRRGAIVNLKTLAVCLTSVTSIPLGADEVKDSTTFRIVFCTLAELMNALIVHRLDVVAFRSHIFLQCFQYLVEVLTRRADQKNKLTDGEILNVRTCGHSIERLCQSMKLGQKEFSRVSPYFITVLIKQFELLAVYPAVKLPLLGGCYKLLDLCDDHGTALLNSLLTVGSKEILKTIYDQYKKFYQYKGRV